MSTLPRAWLQGETIEHLKMFATLIQQLSEQLDQANPAHKYVSIDIFVEIRQSFFYIANCAKYRCI